MGIFPYRGGALVAFKLKALPVTSYSYITIHLIGTTYPRLMGVPASEVGYTSATTRREITKSMTDMWWHWIKIENFMIDRS
jgi:hypothetical protein